MAFIEITSRLNASVKQLLNQDKIIRVTDDGIGAVITYQSKDDNAGKGIATEKADETYATVKTALGL